MRHVAATAQYFSDQSASEKKDDKIKVLPHNYVVILQIGSQDFTAFHHNAKFIGHTKVIAPADYSITNGNCFIVFLT